MTIKALFNAKSGVREREMIKGISCGQAEQSSGAEKSRCGRAEQWRDGTHRPRDGRAEQWGDDSQADQTSMEPGSNWNDSRADQTSMEPGSSNWNDCQADQTKPEPGSSIFTTCSSSKTLTITRCHTRKWPVARYVKFPSSSPKVQKLTLINPGNKLPDGDQAEQGKIG